MKRNLITLITAAVLIIIFVLLLFTFQVRYSEVAVVTTFGRITGAPREPGLHLRWPWPIQQVYKFDQRTQNFEDKFTENLTADSITLMSRVYVGWRISDPAAFLNSFRDGSVAAAQSQLQSILGSVKSAVVSSNTLADFVNADTKQLKFDQIQYEIEQIVQAELQTNSYGIQVEFLGLKQLGLPDSVTQAVFDRMKAERNILISRAQNEGQAEAIKIRANADRQANITLADARAEATRIRGEGEAEAAKTLPVFQENPDLAVFLLRIDALQQSLGQKTTWIFDQRTPPFDLFQGIQTNLPGH
ncbi:MAG TPA: protease modulator HflC [Candidatus Limnocylindrales bacterium]|nr:protease modulator HflC [Candidatus Limnocylindrales bacterium]